MSKNNGVLAFGDLETMYLQRRQAIEEATAQVERLRGELQQAERTLEGLLRGTVETAGKLVNVSAQSKRPQPPQFRRKPGDGPTVVDLAMEIMTQSSGPMTLADISDAVLAKGYKTTGKKFTKTVGSRLQRKPDIFRRIAPGLYDLASRAKAAAMPRVPSKKARVQSVQNPEPLANYLVKALTASGEPMTVPMLTKQSEALGYKTNSDPQTFSQSIVSRMCRDSRFKRVGPGVYGLAVWDQQR